MKKLKNKCYVSIPGKNIDLVVERNPTVYVKGYKGYFAGRQIVYGPISDMTRAMRLNKDIKKCKRCKAVLYAGQIVGRLKRYQSKPNKVKVMVKKCR